RIGTQESRGIDITVTDSRSPLIEAIMMASVRCAPACHWDGSPAEIRLSEPRMRMFTGSAVSLWSSVDLGTVGRSVPRSANGSAKRSIALSSRCSTKSTAPTTPTTSTPIKDRETIRASLPRERGVMGPSRSTVGTRPRPGPRSRHRAVASASQYTTRAGCRVLLDRSVARTVLLAERCGHVSPAAGEGRRPGSEPDLNLPDEDLLQRGHLLLGQLQGAGGGIVLQLGDAGGGRDLGAHPVQGDDVGERQRAHLHLPLLGQLADAAHGGELLLADAGERALVEQPVAGTHLVRVQVALGEQTLGERGVGHEGAPLPGAQVQ